MNTKPFLSGLWMVILASLSILSFAPDTTLAQNQLICPPGPITILQGVPTPIQVTVMTADGRPAFNVIVQIQVSPCLKVNPPATKQTDASGTVFFLVEAICPGEAEEILIFAQGAGSCRIPVCIPPCELECPLPELFLAPGTCSNDIPVACFTSEEKECPDSELDACTGHVIRARSSDPCVTVEPTVKDCDDTETNFNICCTDPNNECQAVVTFTLEDANRTVVAQCELPVGCVFACSIATPDDLEIPSGESEEVLIECEEREDVPGGCEGHTIEALSSNPGCVTVEPASPDSVQCGSGDPFVVTCIGEDCNATITYTLKGPGGNPVGEPRVQNITCVPTPPPTCGIECAPEVRIRPGRSENVTPQCVGEGCEDLEVTAEITDGGCITLSSDRVSCGDPFTVTCNAQAGECSATITYTLMDGDTPVGDPCVQTVKCTTTLCDLEGQQEIRILPGGSRNVTLDCLNNCAPGHTIEAVSSEPDCITVLPENGPCGTIFTVNCTDPVDECERTVTYILKDPSGTPVDAFEQTVRCTTVLCEIQCSPNLRISPGRTENITPLCVGFDGCDSFTITASVEPEAGCVSVSPAGPQSCSTNFQVTCSASAEEGCQATITYTLKDGDTTLFTCEQTVTCTTTLCDLEGPPEIRITPGGAEIVRPDCLNNCAPGHTVEATSSSPDCVVIERVDGGGNSGPCGTLFRVTCIDPENECDVTITYTLKDPAGEPVDAFTQTVKCTTTLCDLECPPEARIRPGNSQNVTPGCANDCAGHTIEAVSNSSCVSVQVFAGDGSCGTTFRLTCTSPTDECDAIITYTLRDPSGIPVDTCIQIVRCLNCRLICPEEVVIPPTQFFPQRINCLELISGGCQGKSITAQSSDPDCLSVSPENGSCGTTFNITCVDGECAGTVTYNLVRDSDGAVVDICTQPVTCSRFIVTAVAAEFDVAEIRRPVKTEKVIKTRLSRPSLVKVRVQEFVDGELIPSPDRTVECELDPETNLSCDCDGPTDENGETMCTITRTGTIGRAFITFTISDDSAVKEKIRLLPFGP